MCITTSNLYTHGKYLNISIMTLYKCKMILPAVVSLKKRTPTKRINVESLPFIVIARSKLESCNMSEYFDTAI